jgi:SHS family lactate transporter-like MFS transporter
VGQKTLVRALRDLTWIQWSMVFSGWLAWTCDAMDFFSVSLAVPVLSKPPPIGFNRGTNTLVSHPSPFRLPTLNFFPNSQRQQQ